MSEHTTAIPQPTEPPDETPRLSLLAVAAAAITAGFVVILVSAQSATAWIGIALGVSVALAGGFVLGQGWRTEPDERTFHRAQSEPDTAPPPSNVARDDNTDRVDGHDVITPDMLINDDHPTVAMRIPPPPALPIDSKPEPEALAAKDKVIESLEAIVRENRDEWAGFEAEREALQTRINTLEAELKVATDLVENRPDGQGIERYPAQVVDEF